MATATLSPMARRGKTRHQKTNWAPTAKVSAGVLAAAVVTLLMPSLKHWLSANDPAAAGAALTTIVTFAVQYFVPERK